MSILQKVSCSRRSIGRVDHTAPNPRAGISRGIGFQIIFLLVHDNRFADDRIRAVELQFSFPIEVRLAGSIGRDVAEVAGVMLSGARSAVMLMRRIEMSAGRCRIRRRTIAFLVNVESVLSRFEILNIGDDLNFVAALGECDRACNLTAGFRLQCRHRFCDPLRLRERRESAEHR